MQVYDVMQRLIQDNLHAYACWHNAEYSYKLGVYIGWPPCNTSFEHACHALLYYSLHIGLYYPVFILGLLRRDFPLLKSQTQPRKVWGTNATLHQFDRAYFYQKYSHINLRAICKILEVMTLFSFFFFCSSAQAGLDNSVLLVDFQWSPPTFLIPLQRRNSRINTGTTCTIWKSRIYFEL